jgi:hypothetical protein
MERVRLVDLDEDLAASIPEEDRAIASQNLAASLTTLEPGPIESLEELVEPDCVGLLIVDGLLTRDVEFAGSRSRELLGGGDVLRPWDREQDYMAPFASAGFTVLEPARVAHLDERLLRLGARWPTLVDELIRRAIQRSRGLAIRLAIGETTRIDERLMLFLWYAAGRWGRVTQEGVLVPFGLTHEVLAELIGAQRPSVTTAISDLRRQERLETRADGFLLLDQPPS